MRHTNISGKLTQSPGLVQMSSRPSPQKPKPRPPLALLSFATLEAQLLYAASGHLVCIISGEGPYLGVLAHGGEPGEVEIGGEAAELEELGEGGPHVAPQGVLLVAERRREREVPRVARALLVCRTTRSG
jgi:hypothetical protein